MIGRQSRVLVVAGVAAATICLAACAAHGPRNTAQVGALTVGQLAIDLSKQEQVLYAANVNGYDKTAHDKVGAAILRVLYASRAYERAVAGWPAAGTSAPATVDAAGRALNLALDDVELALPPAANVRDPLARALAAVRAAMAPLASGAEMPPGGVLGFLALVNVFAQMIAAGKTTIVRIRGFLEQEGATPEQLAAMDAALTDEIAVREAETPLDQSGASSS